MNDIYLVDRFAPYSALILQRHLSYGGKLRIPVAGKLPPIDPDHTIDGVRRRDTSHPGWITRAVRRFAELHPDLVTVVRAGRLARYQFTATPEQMAALEAYVVRCRDQGYYHNLPIGAPVGVKGFAVSRASHPNGQWPLRECSPSPELVLSWLGEEFVNPKREQARQVLKKRLTVGDAPRRALSDAILLATQPHAVVARDDRPVSSLLGLIGADCPADVAYVLIRLSTFDAERHVRHILAAAAFGWWQRVLVLLQGLEREFLKIKRPVQYQDPPERVRLPILRTIRDYVSVPLGKKRVIEKRRFSATDVALRLRGMTYVGHDGHDMSIVSRRAYQIFAVRHVAKKFGFKSAGGKSFWVDDAIFLKLLLAIERS